MRSRCLFYKHVKNDTFEFSVVFTTYQGYKILDAKKLQALAQQYGHDIYETRFYRRIRSAVDGCLRRRWLVIGATFCLCLVACRLQHRYTKAVLPGIEPGRVAG